MGNQEAEDLGAGLDRDAVLLLLGLSSKIGSGVPSPSLPRVFAMASRTCTIAGSPSERMRSRPCSPASPSQ
eukprot:12022756-Heterocapsa_arctica.AAC.1